MVLKMSKSLFDIRNETSLIITEEFPCKLKGSIQTKQQSSLKSFQQKGKLLILLQIELKELPTPSIKRVKIFGLPAVSHFLKMNQFEIKRFILNYFYQ